MSTIGRRQFLYCIGGAGAAALSSLAASHPVRDAQPNLAVDAGTTDGHRRSVTRIGWAFGSTASITALHRERTICRRALSASFDELERVERLMSIYRANSQLSQLNRHRSLTDPDPLLVEILLTAQAFSEKTAGAFDITIQPLWQLYADTHRDGRLPSDADACAARALVDWRRVEVTPQRVRLHGEGTMITLNGIAQGFAADRVRRTLQRFGVEHALINTGEIAPLGQKARGEGWSIGIQHPRADNAFCSIAKLAERCLATSGDYATWFSPDRLHHHLFDPRTGRSPTELSSVSIAARTATEADALSTAVFVLGSERGLALVQQTPGADAMLIDKGGRTITTAGFPAA
jgi:thiamine biosynthesis lipoprotein